MNTLKYFTISCCRLCKSTDLKMVLDFGEVPLANAYPERIDAHEDLYPLTVAKCGNCGHVQLGETVDPKILFKDYLFVSSDSPALVSHLEEFAQFCRFIALDRVLEIGCNDGPLLRHFKQRGVQNLYGVEPAARLADKARECGALVFEEFFSQKLAAHIRELHGPMDLICSTNTFAHIADLESVVAGIETLLSDDGVFVFENAYLPDTVRGRYFDQFYHEHLQYYSIRPLLGFFARFGLEIFAVQHLSTQGGSIRVCVKRRDGRRRGPHNAMDWVMHEQEAYVFSDYTYDFFQRDIYKMALRFEDLIRGLKDQGKTISCYGCPAKFTLFSHFFNLNRHKIDYVVDDSPMKQGRFTPGLKIPIVSNAHFRSDPTDYCVTTAWNMADAIIRQNPQYSGKWVNPFKCAG